MAPERRAEARPAVRQWVHRAVVCPRPEARLEAASYRRPEVHPQAVSSRQPAACRGRRAVDRFAARERRSAVHRRAVSYRQPVAWSVCRAADRFAATAHLSAAAQPRPVASSWLRRRAAVRPVRAWPAAPESALRPAAVPSSRRRADPSGGSAAGEAVAAWVSAQPSEAALPLPAEVERPAEVVAAPSFRPEAVAAQPALAAEAAEQPVSEALQRAVGAPSASAAEAPRREEARPASVAEPRQEAERGAPAAQLPAVPLAAAWAC